MPVEAPQIENVVLGAVGITKPVALDATYCTEGLPSSLAKKLISTLTKAKVPANSEEAAAALDAAVVLYRGKLQKSNESAKARRLSKKAPLDAVSEDLPLRGKEDPFTTPLL